MKIGRRDRTIDLFVMSSGALEYIIMYVWCMGVCKYLYLSIYLSIYNIYVHAHTHTHTHTHIYFKTLQFENIY